MLKPLFNRVLLEREKLARVGNIIIPDEAQKRHSNIRGTVVARGPDADEQIKEGMEVIFGLYAGSWVNAEGKPTTKNDEAEFFLLNDEDILCEVVR